MSSRSDLFRSALGARVLVADGAMGTMIQDRNLGPDDFEGLDGCNEFLVETRPNIIREIHAAYYAAGSDIVETNTFGGAAHVLAEYGLQDKTHALSLRAAELARAAAENSASRGKIPVLIRPPPWRPLV